MPPAPGGVLPVPPTGSDWAHFIRRSDRSRSVPPDLAKTADSCQSADEKLFREVTAITAIMYYKAKVTNRR